MDLDQESIEDVKRIWKEEFDEEISDGDARLRANELLELYFVLAGGKSDSMSERASES